MKNKRFSAHIWRAIESQAKAVADSMSAGDFSALDYRSWELVNEFELNRLRLLIQQLEEESPN